MDAAFSGMSVFNNFLLIDASDRSKISSDKSAYFSRRLPLKIRYQEKKMTIEIKKNSNRKYNWQKCYHREKN